MVYIFLALIPVPFIGSLILALVRYKRKHDIAWGRRKENPQEEKSLNTWIAPLALLEGFIIGLFVFVFCAFELHWWLKLAYILLGLLLEGLMLGLMAGWFTWKRFLAWCACVLLAVGTIWGTARYDRYLQEISLPESFDYRSFTPFVKDSPAATLDEPSSLRFADVDTVPRMDGATALYPVYAAFAQATYPEIMAEMPESEILKIVDCSTTGYAYRSIVDGDCDIIFVAGPSKEQEAYAAEQGVELVYTPIGREAFVFFVHPDNPVESLTLEQLRGVYSGQITRWDALGAPGLGEILAYQRSEGSGSQTALERFVMGDTPLMPAEKEKVMTAMDGIVERVSSYHNHRNAIGYSFRFYCTGLMRGFDVKLLAVEGVAPTVENIENGSYPLASYFYAVTRADADENTLALLAWITGPQGQELVEKAGYTPLA